jgi:hypothetical protein
MKIIKLIALPLIFVSILFTSCSKEEEEVTPEATIVEYNYDLGVITPNEPTSPKIAQEVLTSYELEISDFFSEYNSIKSKVSSFSFEYENIYSIKSNSIGNDGILMLIRCDYSTYQNNENSFIITIIDSDNTTHKISVTFKLFEDETFKLVKALINNSRNNTLKLTNTVTGDSFTGVDLADFEMSNDNSAFNQYPLTFKFSANQNSGSAAGGGLIINNNNNGFMYMSLSSSTGNHYLIWSYIEGENTVTTGVRNFEVNGNTVNGVGNSNLVTFTLN